MFSIVKYLGAIYLIYIGLRAVLAKDEKLKFDTVANEDHSDWKNFRSGFITNVLNPKVALVFLSVFPQFINEEHIESPIPFVILGLTYAALGVLWYLTLSLFASIFSGKLKENPKFNNYLNKFSGIVFVLMGIKVALSKK